MRVLDLFSGIGGMSLGLQRAGFETVAFCEIDPYCQRVLAQHWPGVPIYEDVRTLTGGVLDDDGIRPDIITAGFPCQDVSIAGSGAGLDGPRSGLWKDALWIIADVRPGWILLENVAALLDRGAADVFSDLAKIGYDCCWHCIPASAIGAPHRRDRLWALAYTNAPRSQTPWEETVERAQQRIDRRDGTGKRTAAFRGRWAAEPGVDRMANGLPGRVDRIKGLGNSVVPQIPEMFGRAILNAMKSRL